MYRHIDALWAFLTILLFVFFPVLLIEKDKFYFHRGKHYTDFLKCNSHIATVVFVSLKTFRLQSIHKFNLFPGSFFFFLERESLKFPVGKNMCQHFFKQLEYVDI